MTPFPVRPPISLLEILAYTFVAFIFALLVTKPFVRFLHRYKLGKKLRSEAVDGGTASVFLKYHQGKAGTPTMGGMLVWGSVFATVLLSRGLSYFGHVEHSLLQRGQVYIPLGVLVAFGVLGAIDDYLNIAGQRVEEEATKRWMRKMKIGVGVLLVFMLVGWLAALVENPLSTAADPVRDTWNRNVGIGLSLVAACTLLPLAFGGKRVDAWLRHVLVGTGKQAGIRSWPKLFFLIVLSAIPAYWFYVRLKYQAIAIPFGESIGLASGSLDLGWYYVPFFLFVVIGTANAVNVTDGLDGLAGGLLMITFAAFGVLAYVSGLYVLAAFCGAVVGALAGFLWHNVPPAIFFMGDTGSLALGGTLAVMAFMINQVLVLPLVGFIFVLEMLSVIIQLTSKRLRNGKKIFRSAPFHHHLEALDWGESKVTMRLWIVGMFAAFLGVLVGIYG